MRTIALQQLIPYVKIGASGVGSVLAVAYVAPLPTTPEGWVHYCCYMGLVFLGGVGLYRTVPNGAVKL